MVRPSAFAVAAFVCALSFQVAADEIRIHGATTVTYGLIKPNKEKIEKLASVTLAILPSSTSRGLVDLVQGKADIAMLAEPLEMIAASMNAKQPGSVDTEVLIGKHVGDAYVLFIVHPSNPLQRLSKDQLARLFSGRARNWSDVGGTKIPVLLVGEPTSSPHRVISEALSISYDPELRAVQNTNQTAIVVMQAPGALSYISTAHELPERNRLKVLESEVRLPLALYLAFRKDAPIEVKKVVQAAAAIAGK
jgi:phosphate transport system substrate-binding protein